MPRQHKKKLLHIILGVVGGVILATLLFATVPSILPEFSTYAPTRNPKNTQEGSPQKIDLKQYLSEFPDPAPGYNRFVIYPDLTQPVSEYRVDVLIGEKNAPLCNSCSLDPVEVELLDGTHHYQITTQSSYGACTEMACIDPEYGFHAFFNPNLPSALRFFSNADNTYLPIVVDVNSGLDVSYQLWKLVESGAPVMEL